MQKPIEKPIKFVKNLSTKGKSYPITHVSAVIDDNGESVKSTIDSLKNKGSVTKVTWQELKNKRDAGKLIPGSLYRITDYQCTTTQENTRSAGHQFDIVLLALSENKLAEEGWAMMNESNVYDVTFNDGVTKKCYYYQLIDKMGEYNENLVVVDTLLGFSYHAGTISTTLDGLIDESNKTIDLSSTPFKSKYLVQSDIIYNYFQNSNLSAWKVWYCLDNDKSRFAWADDSVDESVPASIKRAGGTSSLIFIRDESKDVLDNNINYYAWFTSEWGGIKCFTKDVNPSIGDDTYTNTGSGIMRIETNSEVVVYNQGHEGTGLPNGRGVIYRLIDEWGNDVPYDFKNILYLTKVNAGSFDKNGTEEYIPTFCLYDNSSNEYKDASIFAIEYVNDEGGICPCYNNSINSASAFNSPIDYSNKYCYALPCIIFLSSVKSGSSSWTTYNNKLISVYNSTFEGTCSTNIVLGSSTHYIDLYHSFVYGSTKASMESI